MATRSGFALALAVLFAALLAGSSAPPAGAGQGTMIPGGAVTANESGCAAPPSALPAGPVAFQVTNATRDFAAVYIVAPGGGAVFAEIRSLPPGLTRPLAGTLGPGRYALRCVFSNGVVRTSSSYTVTGTTSGAAPGVKPLPDLDMEGPVDAYRALVSAALPGLRSACQALDADVARGDLTAARRDWLTAHLGYERLGAAYNSFGDFDGAINGMAQGLSQGTASADWTGFFAIEYGLWHGYGAARLRPLTTGLAGSVEGLVQDFPSEDIDPGNLPLRAHEILENALQFQLTGIADYGSGTTLATLYANTQGTQAVLGTISPLIEQREPALLSAINQWMKEVQARLLTLRAPDGTWTPLAQLTTAQRQSLDGALGGLLEQLSAVPDLLAPRTSA